MLLTESSTVTEERCRPRSPAAAHHMDPANGKEYPVTLFIMGTQTFFRTTALRIGTPPTGASQRGTDWDQLRIQHGKCALGNKEPVRTVHGNS